MPWPSGATISRRIGVTKLLDLCKRWCGSRQVVGLPGLAQPLRRLAAAARSRRTARLPGCPRRGTSASASSSSSGAATGAASRAWRERAPSERRRSRGVMSCAHSLVGSGWCSVGRQLGRPPPWGRWGCPETSPHATVFLYAAVVAARSSLVSSLAALLGHSRCACGPPDFARIGRHMCVPSVMHFVRCAPRRPLAHPPYRREGMRATKRAPIGS